VRFYDSPILVQQKVQDYSIVGIQLWIISGILIQFGPNIFHGVGVRMGFLRRKIL